MKGEIKQTNYKVYIKNEQWARIILLDPPDSKTFGSVLDIKTIWETFEQTQPSKHHKMTVK